MFFHNPHNITVTFIREEKKPSTHKELKLNDPDFKANCYVCNDEMEYYQHQPEIYMECSCCDHKLCRSCETAIEDYLCDNKIYDDHYSLCPCFLIHGYDKKNFPRTHKCLSAKEICDLIRLTDAENKSK